LADSQLELTSLKARESELRQQQDKLVAMDTHARSELSDIKLQLAGEHFLITCTRTFIIGVVIIITCQCLHRWLGSRVVSVVDSGTEGPGFKSQL